MIEYDLALVLAQEECDRLPPPPAGDEILVWNEKTVERPFGWVFFYQGRRYIESGDDAHMLVGLPALLVDRRDGSVHRTSTAVHWIRHVQDYERANP